MSTAQKVEVQMGDGLSGFGTAVGDQSPAPLETVLLGELARGREACRQDGGVLVRRLGKRWNGLHRDHERVEGGLRVDVLDRETEVFAQKEPGGNGTIVELLEECAAHGVEKYAIETEVAK